MHGCRSASSGRRSAPRRCRRSRRSSQRGATRELDAVVLTHAAHRARARRCSRRVRSRCSPSRSCALVYERGASRPRTASDVAALLAASSRSRCRPGSTQQIAVRAFYARSDTWRPMVLGDRRRARGRSRSTWPAGGATASLGLAVAAVAAISLNATVHARLAAGRVHGAPGARARSPRRVGPRRSRSRRCAAGARASRLRLAAPARRTPRRARRGRCGLRGVALSVSAASGTRALRIAASTGSSARSCAGCGARERRRERARWEFCDRSRRDLHRLHRRRTRRRAPHREAALVGRRAACEAIEARARPRRRRSRRRARCRCIGRASARPSRPTRCSSGAACRPLLVANRGLADVFDDRHPGAPRRSSPCEIEKPAPPARARARGRGPRRAGRRADRAARLDGARAGARGGAARRARGRWRSSGCTPTRDPEDEERSPPLRARGRLRDTSSARTRSRARSACSRAARRRSPTPT